MNDLKNSIGKRLREIRNIFLEGDKVSSRQFANALGETKDNIANYENGRANIPNRLLLKLYERGFNPIFILSGEGSMFAENENGDTLKERIETKRNRKGTVLDIREFDYSKLSVRELERKVMQYQVAAGDIKKIIDLKTNEET
ncbi:helix-turn-helix domain-containing protein [Bacteroidota bacterium]